MLAAARTTPLLRFAVSKSHKLLLATVILIGGYGTALLLGSLSRWVVPSSGHQPAGSTGVLVPMRTSEMAVQLPPTMISADTEVRRSGAVVATIATPAMPNPVEPHDTPMWLATTSDVARTHDLPAQTTAPRPTAKVNDITPWGTTATTKTPSPWDRWPHWDAGATANDTTKIAGIEAKKNKPAVNLQASYHRTDATGDQFGDTDSRSMRTHIVVDGDSLAKLADRYFDDPEQAETIYELNRDVLASPELLPIGVELRIPDPTMTSTAKLSNAALQSVAASTITEPRRFEPVEQWLDSANDVPRAKLLQPVPIGQGP